MQAIKDILGMNGSKVITDTISVFQDVTSKLEKGIELCKKEIEDKKMEIVNANTRISELTTSTDRAESVITNIKKFIGE